MRRLKFAQKKRLIEDKTFVGTKSVCFRRKEGFEKIEVEAFASEEDSD